MKNLFSLKYDSYFFDTFVKWVYKWKEKELLQSKH